MPKRTGHSLKDFGAVGRWKSTLVLEAVKRQADIDKMKEVVLGSGRLRVS